MHFCFFFLDEMHAIISACCEEVSNFLSIFAAIEVEYEFLSGKDVRLVEGAACHLLVLFLFEHYQNIELMLLIMSDIKLTSFIEIEIKNLFLYKIDVPYKFIFKENRHRDYNS